MAPPRTADARPRRRGLSLRVQLTLSYAGFLVVAGGVFSAVLLFVLRFVPDENLQVAGVGGFVPNRGDLLEVAVPLAALGAGFLAVTGLAGGWLLAGRVLRPVRAIGEAAEAAARGSMSHRIRLPGADDELRRLADGFDHMLDRLERAFDEQRRFTANASHELRTPQAVTKALLQVARSDPDGRDVDLLLVRLEETNDRASAVLESLLQLARADAGDVTLVRHDLVAVVGDVLAQGTPLGPGVRLDLKLPPTGHADVLGHRELLAQLVGNLVRNAALHNVEEGGCVRVRVDTGRAGTTLTVENTGEVLEPDLLRRLTEPFVRADGRTRPRNGHRGSGLGLAIVASIARAHQAELSLQPRPTGGLVVVVQFSTPEERVLLGE